MATQFCLELAFGVLLALAFVPRAPVGLFFYRLMGTTAMLPALVALAVPLLVGVESFASPATAAAALPVLAYPFYSGPVRGWRWGGALGVALLGTVAGLFLAIRAQGLGEAGTSGLLATCSAAATGAVAGSVGLAMVLGHWYLTVPKLEVEHLRRLNRVTVGSMAASCLLLALSVLLYRDVLQSDGRAIVEPFGLFHLGTRVVVGLALPLLFAAMAASSLRYRNTRSATGILYASTVLVLIGTALSISLQDSYRFPL